MKRNEEFKLGAAKVFSEIILNLRDEAESMQAELERAVLKATNIGERIHGAMQDNIGVIRPYDSDPDHDDWDDDIAKWLG